MEVILQKMRFSVRFFIFHSSFFIFLRYLCKIFRIIDKT